ncbi:hypothetical protein ACYRFS_13035 [Listeria kieliensis]
MLLTMEKVLESKEIKVKDWDNEVTELLFQEWQKDYEISSSYMNALSLRKYIDFSWILSFDEYHEEAFQLLSYLKKKGFWIEENPFIFPGSELSMEEFVEALPEALKQGHTIYDVCDYLLEGEMNDVLDEQLESCLSAFVITRDDVQMGDALDLARVYELQKALINMLVFEKNRSLRYGSEMKLYELPFK